MQQMEFKEKIANAKLELEDIESPLNTDVGDASLADQIIKGMMNYIKFSWMRSPYGGEKKRVLNF